MVRKRRVSDAYSLHQAALMNNALKIETLENSILPADLEVLTRVEGKVRPQRMKETLGSMFRRAQRVRDAPPSPIQNAWDFIRYVIVH
jgi:hypothetical protein